jgi:hypothetical protein
MFRSYDLTFIGQQGFRYKILVAGYKNHGVKIPQHLVKTLKEMGICAEDHKYAKDDSCCICLGPYQKSESVSHLSCGHFLHTRCLLSLPQIGANVELCPLCRANNVPVFCQHKI